MKRIAIAATLAASLILPVAAQQTPAPQPTVAMPTTAEGFRRMAMMSDAFEIQSSRLALEKSRNGIVRRFAQDMVRDHSMTSQALMGGAPAPATTASTAGLDPRHAAMLQQLAAAPQGRAFDRLYGTMQRQAHSEAVALFTAYAQQGTDPNLRAFAQQTLHHLQRHIARARNLPRAG
jgi:putative membrane protein